MAADYETGSASSPNDLLQKLVTWLVAQGWTQNMSQADGSAWRAHLSKGGQYVNLRSIVNENNVWTYQSSTAGYGIALYLSDAYSGALAWKSQVTAPVHYGTSNTVGAGMSLGSGAVAAYHFFDDGNDNITVVVNRGADTYVHMGWGRSLAKVGFSSDYWYFYGSSSSYYNANVALALPGHALTATAPMGLAHYYSAVRYTSAFVRVDAAVYSSRWVGLSYGTDTWCGYTGRDGRSLLDFSGSFDGSAAEHPNLVGLKDRAWQTAFTGALLIPMHIFCYSTAGRWIPIGYPLPELFFGGVGHGFSAGQVIQVGGLDYMVFPDFAVRKAA